MEQSLATLIVGVLLFTLAALMNITDLGHEPERALRSETPSRTLESPVSRSAPVALGDDGSIEPGE